MRIVVVGGTGNVGLHLLPQLLAQPAVTSVAALSRREPSVLPAGVQWSCADTTETDLTALFAGADVVVNLAFALQPAHHPDLMHRTNVVGTQCVFDAVVRAGVPALVHASSVAAYAPGPGGDVRLSEGHPTTGVPTSLYSRHKAEAETALDAVEDEHPDLRVVRLRPGLVLSAAAASALARSFLGPYVPQRVLRPGLIPLVPAVPGLTMPVVHSEDVAQAFVLAATRDVRGAFNISAEPPLTMAVLAKALQAREVPVPRAVARVVADLTWRLHLQPTDPGWLDLGTSGLVMDTSRARDVLGWTPQRDAVEALLELLDGFAGGTGAATPVLAPRATGAGRVMEAARAVVPGSRRTG